MDGAMKGVKWILLGLIPLCAVMATRRQEPLRPTSYRFVGGINDPNAWWDDANDIYTINGRLDVNDVNVATYLDLLEMTAPSTPTSNKLRLYVEDIHGFSFFKYFDSTGMKREIVRDSVILVYNGTGSTILPNRVVYATGNIGSVPSVALAQSNASATMPAIGVTIESIADTAYGRVMQVGLLENLNTLALSVGDVLYVHDTVAGLVRITPPTTPALTQEIGTVLVDSATVGAIQVVTRSLTGNEFGTLQNDWYIGDGTSTVKTIHLNAATDATVAWDDSTGLLTISDPVVIPQGTTTLGAGVTTFAVASNVMTITGDGGGNTVATITGAADSMLLTLIFVDANVTMANDDTHGANTLDLNGNLTSADDTVLQLIFDGTSWYEISRSVN
jgi:hypothetical protein